jgi:type VI secretion system protein ImpK
MNDRFAPLVEPFLQSVIATRRRIAGPAADHPGLDEVHDELMRLIRKARHAAASLDRPADYTEMAEYALVYWADEVLINSSWAHAEDWRKHRLLEQALYREAVGGDAFFEKAKRARAESTDALETFFLCVALGFQGRYARDRARRPRWHDSGPVDPALLQWVGDAYRRVRPALEPFLPRDDDEGGGPARLPGRALFLRVSVLTALTVLSTMIALILSEHL